SFLVLDPEGRIRHDFQFNSSLNDGGTLVDRCHAAASEPDPSRRRRLIGELWAAEGAYVTDTSASRGYLEIDVPIAALQTNWAATRLVLMPAVNSQAHHHVAWFQSLLRMKDSDRACGIVSHLLILGEDGRIGCDYEFKEPA